MFVSEQEEEEEGEEGGGPTTCTLGDNCQDTQQGETNKSGLTWTGACCSLVYFNFTMIFGFL